MQAILSIDASHDPACIQVVEVKERTLRVAHNSLVSLADGFSKEALFAEAGVVSADGSAGPGPATAAEVSSTSTDPKSNALKQALADVTIPWANCILLVPPLSYLSLNIDLPFRDARHIEKVLDLEVQDQLPFDISEFLIEHRALSESAGQGYDIHVGMMPKICLENALRYCRMAELEPLIITTPGSALEALFILGPDYFAANAAVILARDTECYVLVRTGGQARFNRVLSNPSPAGQKAAPPACSWPAELVAELKLTLAVAESRYQCRIEQVYLISGQLSPYQLQQVLGRNVQAVDLCDVTGGDRQSSSVATLAALFAQDAGSPPILSNFRTREFVYSPQLRELVLGLKRLVPYLAVLLAAAVLSLGVAYYSREAQIRQMNNAMRERVLSIMPNVPLNAGREVAEVVLDQNKALSDDLGQLASPSRLTPLDSFFEISRDLAGVSNISVDSLTLTGSAITLKGVAAGEKSGYAAQGDLEKVLKKNKRTYCRVGLDSNSSKDPRSGAGVLNFTFDLKLCE